MKILEISLFLPSICLSGSLVISLSDGGRMSTSIGGGAVFFGEEVAPGWERRLAVVPSSSTRCCGGCRVGGGISVAELAGRWYVTVGLVTVTTAVVGGAVSRRRVVGIGAGVLLTARARRSVGWSSRPE